MCHYLYYELDEAHWNGAAEHCDHVIPISQGGAPEDDNNLWGICKHHHNVKTGLEQHGLNIQVMPGRGGLVPVDKQEVIRRILKIKEDE